MNDIIEISKQIIKKIKEIDIIRAEIKQRGDDKARAASVYDMEISKTLIGLENGKTYELDGEKIKEPPKSIMEKVAKGICWDKKLEMDSSEAAYKSVITNLSAVQAQLNALQSLNKHLE